MSVNTEDIITFDFFKSKFRNQCEDDNHEMGILPLCPSSYFSYMIWGYEDLMEILLNYREIIGDVQIEKIFDILDEDITFLEDEKEISYINNYMTDCDNAEEQPEVERLMHAFYIITWVKHEEFLRYIEGFRYHYKWIMDTFLDKETIDTLDRVLNLIKIVNQDLKMSKKIKKD